MNDTTTSTPGERDVRQQVPLWRLTGTFTLLTPLHVGTGRDAEIRLDEDEDRMGSDKETRAQDESRYVATVVRDHQHRPCIPASSFKGALAALARRVDGIDAAQHERLFGAVKGDKTASGGVEFTYLYATPDSLVQVAKTSLPQFNCEGHPHVANLAHVSRNRDTGAAEAQRLFLSQVVPPGVVFGFECTARGLSREDMGVLLGLLVLAGDAQDGLRLGAGKAADQGRVSWQPRDVWCLEAGRLAALWASDDGRIWTDRTRVRDLKTINQTVASGNWLRLDSLELDFHSPFLVYERTGEKKGSGKPNGKPRTDHAGRAVLPSTSLHGALRAQAERILRTIGQPAPRTDLAWDTVHDLEAVAKLDLASVLFGAPGWRSLLRCSDFVDDGTSQDITHHMLAIDRLTGGGKDSAKFSITVRDCPTLNGSLALDQTRLKAIEAKRPGVTAQVLGLLAHVLRDLDEGDVPLGYGASKGYGQLRSGTAGELRTALGGVKFSQALAAFADLSDQEETACRSAALVTPALTPEERLPLPSAPAGPDTFHNPYVFIPFGTPRPDDARLPWADRAALDKGQAAHHSHARYANEAFHGRIVCRVTAKTPIFVGTGDVPGTTDPKQKQNYTLNLRIGKEKIRRCALPATSLRGMVSSLHESITASRLRAATDRRYSVRYVNDMNRTDPNPSAIGRLIRIEGLPGLWLQMLALPLLTLGRDGRAYLDKAYTRTLIQPKDDAPLKSLFGDLDTDMSALVPEPGKRPMHFMQDRLGLRVQQERDGRCHVEFPRQLDDVHIKQAGKTTFVLGARRRKGEMPERTRVAGGVMGVVRVMRAEERDLPEGREHEVFVPFSKAQQEVKPQAEARLKAAQAQGRAVDLAALQRDFRLLPVPDEVVERFCRLADEMTATQDNKDDLHENALRPYHPRGTRRNDEKLEKEDVHGDLDPKHRNRALRPQHNDLVYFRPNKDGTAIAEISYSSMWRREIEGSTKDLVGHKEWLPDGDVPVTNLSPSELIFGTVQVRKSAGNRPDDEPIAAWMSKVRFSAGVSLVDITPGPVQTLKILSSPKPPSPSMYFQPKGQPGGAHVSKADLWARPGDYQLKGRKTYLHAHQEFARRPDGSIGQRRVRPLNKDGYHGGSANPWESDKDAKQNLDNQKVRVAPLPAGSTFHFSIDFHNLSQPELESLCASLRPHADFEHKIGMGKPIGLGSVKVETVGLHLVDRRQRYAQRDFSVAPRYHAQWIDGRQQLPHFLQAEASVSVSSRVAVQPEHLARACMAHLKAQSPAVHRALMLTGDPQRVVAPVHYPQLQRKSIEEESFAWFVNNDKTGQDWSGNPQHLAGFTPKSEALPTLSRVPRRNIGR